MATSTINSSTASPSGPSYGGVDYTGGSQPTGSVLPTSALAPATTNIPYVTPTQPSSSAMPAVEAAANSVDSYIQAMTPMTQQPNEAVGDNLSKQIASLTGQTVNQKQDTFAQEEAMGMSQKIQDLQLAQDKVKNLQAAYQKGYASLWNRDKGMALLSGEQAALKSQAEADIAFAQAEVSAKQGDITTAQTLAKRAVDQKYAPILAQIETKKAQLEALKPLLDKEAAIRSSAQTAALNKLQKEQEAKVQEEKDWNSMKIDASSGGIPPTTLDKADQAFKAGNKNQAYALLGKYGKAYLEKQSLSADIAKKWADAKADATGGAVGSGDFAATISVTKDFLPANVQKTYVNEVQGMINRGDYKSAYQKVQNSVGKGLQGDVKNEFDAKVVAIPSIDKLQKTLDAFVKANGDTSLLRGTADQIERKLGGVTKDKAYSQLATDLNIAFQQYRSDVSGAAFGAGESSAYASVNPSSKNDLELNTAILAGMKQNFQRKVDSTVESMAGDGARYLREYAQNPGLAKKASTPEAQFVNSAVLPALQTTSNVPAGFIVDTKTFTQQFPTK